MKNKLLGRHFPKKLLLISLFAMYFLYTFRIHDTFLKNVIFNNLVNNLVK